MKLKIGQKAPEFTLPDSYGKTHKLKDSLGKWVLIYFYPKDNTPGCTNEACSIRDNYSKVESAGMQIYGISNDSIDSHKKFQEKYSLPFILLSDADKKVVKKYNVYGKKKFMGKEYLGVFRNSFLIDPEGNIAKIYEQVKPLEHAEEFIHDQKNLNRKQI